MKFGDRIGPARRQRIEDLQTLLECRRQRVADHPRRIEVTRGPRRGGASIGGHRLRRKLRRIRGNRLGHVHRIGRQRHDDRRLGVTGMHRQPLLFRRQEFAGDVRNPPRKVRNDGEVAVTHAQRPRGHLHHLRLSAMSVDDQQLPKARAIDRLADFGDSTHQRVAFDRHRPRKMDVLIRLAVADRRHPERRHRIRQSRKRMADDAGGDQRVDRAGQMRAMLLDRSDRQHDDRILPIGKSRDLRPAEVMKKPVRRCEAVQHERFPM